MYRLPSDWRSCPGVAKLLRPAPEYLKCPNCGAEVEIWSDESEIVCDNCGALVTRDVAPSCLEWCKYADKCRELILKARRGQGGE